MAAYYHDNAMVKFSDVRKYLNSLLLSTSSNLQIIGTIIFIT